MSCFCMRMVAVAVAVAIGGMASTADAQIIGACCDRYYMQCDHTTQYECEQYYPNREWMGMFTTCEADCLPAELGACCNTFTQDCYITYEDWCEIEVNYTWLGPDSTCDQCGFVLLGACCDPTTGDCFETSQQECETYPSYIWLGLGVSCDECAQTLGACCNEMTGECYVTTATDCEFQYPGYTYLGDNSTCDECMAPEMGACCDEATGDCTEMTEQECWDYYPGYNWLGPGSTCDECVGQELGSCCYPSGMCMDGIPDRDCVAQGGTWHGPGNMCSVSQEACCLEDGACIDADPLCCSDLGGTPQGEYTGCVDMLIACCLPDGSCIDTDPLCCDDIGGIPGYAQNCVGDLNGNEIDDACEEPVEYCPMPAGEDWCANFRYRDCESDASVEETCMPKTVMILAGAPLVVEECDCFGPDGCGAIKIDGTTLSCPGNCPVPPNNDGDVCQIHVNGMPTGEIAVEFGVIPVDSVVTCDCAPIEEPEACCLSDGTCMDNVAAEICRLINGSPQGPGSVCAGTLEACCLPDGSCVDVDPTCCDDLGGTSQGDSTGCVDMLVACCLPDGSCVDADPLCCDDLGGTSGYEPNCLGDLNGNNVDDACEEPVEYCPIPAGQDWCLNLQYRDCVADPALDETCLPRAVMVVPTGFIAVEECDCFGPGGCGAVQIDGSVLSCPGDCPVPPYNEGDICQIHVDGQPTGQKSMDIGSIPAMIQVTCDCAPPQEEPEACCLPDGSCIDGLTPTECENRGGTPQGAGVVCSGTLEACCMSDGSCMDVDPLCCDELGGVPQGAGSGCVDMLVACCLDDGSCVDTDPTCCDDMGGVIGFQANCMGDSNGNGRDDACEDPDDYCPVPPTSEPWCANLQVRDCLTDGLIDDACLPKSVMVVNGEAIAVEECDCFGPGGCGAVTIELPTLSCVGECPDPPFTPDDICQIHLNGSSTGQTSIDISMAPSGSLVTCDCAEEVHELYPKWEQPPSCMEGFDAASDIWFHEEIPGVKWEQLPDEEWSGLHCHDMGMPGTPEYTWSTLADDWLCEGGVVTDLHWWGNYENNYKGQGISYFHLSIHVDDPIPGPPHGLPVPLEPHVWQMNVPFNQTNETDTGKLNREDCIIYRYDFDLPEPFPQVEGTDYWLDICAYLVAPEANPPVAWRWQESRRAEQPVLGHAPAASRNNDGPWRSIYWNPIPPNTEYRYSDMAFRITSDPEPVQEVNKVVADDFISDGRPIEAVRWWGSYLDERYSPYEPIEPFILDGWIISFHYGDPAILNPGCPPDINLGDGPPTALGLYFAPANAVDIAGVDCTDCLGHSLYEYKVDLSQCTLICAEADPRDGVIPATAEAFLEEAGFNYWLDIQAVVGAKWENVTGAGVEMVYTGHMPSDLTADGHFWGWHTSLTNCLHDACTGEVMLTTAVPGTGSCWNYGNWDKQNWLCPTAPPDPHVNMSFQLLTSSQSESLNFTAITSVAEHLNGTGNFGLEVDPSLKESDGNLRPIEPRDLTVDNAATPYILVRFDKGIAAAMGTVMPPITGVMFTINPVDNREVLIEYQTNLPIDDTWYVFDMAGTLAMDGTILGGGLADSDFWIGYVEADSDGSGAVGTLDKANIAAYWGQSPNQSDEKSITADLDRSGTIGTLDKAEVAANWGDYPS